MKRPRSQSGQIAVEYVLILFVAVTIATLTVKSLISRDDTNPGSFINSWNRILQVIGNDLPDCPGQSDFSKPTCQ